MNKRLILLCCIWLPLLSCTDQIDDLSFKKISPSFSAPIGKLTLGADNLNTISDNVVFREGESNEIEFFYKVELLQTSVFDRFSINPQSFNSTIPFNSTEFSNGVINVSSTSEFNSFTISNVDLADPAAALTKIIFKGGAIEIGQEKNFDHNTVTTITFPKLIKDGVALSVNLTNQESISQSISGYTLDLTGPNGGKVNTIAYEINSEIQETGTSNNGELTLSFLMDGLDYSYFEGDVLQYRLAQVTGEFDLGLPQNEIPNNIRFTDPKIDLFVRNSSGITFGLDVAEISVTEENDEKTLVTGDYQSEQGILDPASGPGQLALSNYTISKENTDNLIELISDIPKSVFFDGFVLANPNSTTAATNFVTDSSFVSIGAELILPMTGYVNNYAISNTFREVDLSLSDDGSIDFENVNLRLISENAFPINISLQLYFMDSTEAEGEIIYDSLFQTMEETLICPAGAVDENGIVSSATTKLSNLTIDKEKYKNIKNSTQIKLVGRLLSPGADEAVPKSIKVTFDNYISISLGLSAQATIDPEKL